MALAVDANGKRDPIAVIELRAAFRIFLRFILPCNHACNQYYIVT